jgi:hypothetical protein
MKYTNIYYSKALQNLPKFGSFENKPSGNPDRTDCCWAKLSPRMHLSTLPLPKSGNNLITLIYPV